MEKINLRRRKYQFQYTIFSSSVPLLTFAFSLPSLALAEGIPLYDREPACSLTSDQGWCCRCPDNDCHCHTSLRVSKSRLWSRVEG